MERNAERKIGGFAWRDVATVWKFFRSRGPHRREVKLVRGVAEKNCAFRRPFADWRQVAASLERGNEEWVAIPHFNFQPTAF
jgi:hypothetical protein